MKRTLRYLPLLSLLLPIPYASAQSSFDLNLGFGTSHVSGIPGILNINSSNPFGTCTVGTDPNCQKGPDLGGFFMGVGGDILATKRFGFGAEVAFQPAKSDYAGLQYRQTFYDLNGIFAPVNQKKVIVKLMGGVGGAKTAFSYSQNCTGIAVCSSASQPVLNTNHFQVHAGLGVELFVTEHIFVRPQFDLHYVPNFTDQFGSNIAPSATVWIGYSWGDR